MGNNTAQILNTVGGVGMNVLFLRFSRDMETQADIRDARAANCGVTLCPRWQACPCGSERLRIS